MKQKIVLDNVCISSDARIVKYKDYSIIGNVFGNGRWLKIPSGFLEYVISFFGIQDGFQLLMESMRDEKERQFYINLLNGLNQLGVLARKEHKEYIKLQCISIELTTMCNLRCKHCSSSYGDNEKVSMSMSDIKKIVQWANRERIEHIVLSGGEIFCMPDINEIITYLGENFNGDIEIMTNATLIKEEHIETIVRYVEKVNISLDGYDGDSVDNIRGKGVYDRVVKCIESLHQHEYRSISLSMVLTSDNRKHLDSFYAFCKKQEAEPMPRVLSLTGRALDNYDELIINKEKGEEEDVVNKLSMVASCSVGTTSVSISATGDVLLCDAMEESNYKIGTIEQLDEVVAKLQEIQINCVVDEIEPCKDCIVRYFCSSSCIANNYHTFHNEELRKLRCDKNKSRLIEKVWENS